MKPTFIESFVDQAVVHSERFCLGYKKDRLTYGEVYARARRMAFELKAQGLAPGDFVMISAVARIDYVIALLAAQFVGAVTIPIDRLIARPTLETLVAYVKPKLLLIDEKIPVPGAKNLSLADLVKHSANPDAREVSEMALRRLEDVSEMLFTTGTTGLPKGAMLSYESVHHITENTRRGVGMRDDDIVLIPLPLNHSVGMRVLRTALSIGAGVVIQSGFTFAREIEINIDNFSCTAMVGVPASIELVRRQMQDKFAVVLGKLRYLELGAGSLSAPMKRTLAAELPDTQIYNTWGSSETGGAIFLDVRNAPDKLNSLGKPVVGVEFAVLREDGKMHTDAVAPESAGRMALRGKMRMMGYFGREADSADAVRGDWLVTNDLAYQDSDGYVFMLGRADDVINVGGEKVAPVEIENVAQEYPGLQECAVIAVADELTGQAPALFYVMNGTPFDKESFIKFMKERVEGYKIPQRFYELEQLPRNRMLKLDRKALKNIAITMSAKSNSENDLDNPIIRNIMSRQSIRDFSDEQVPRAVLEKIVKCGIQAPSGHNMQSWRFTVITNGGVIERFRELCMRKAKTYKAVCYGFNNPPTAILVTNDLRNPNGAQDCACAAENMMLAAHSLGIGSVWQNTVSYMADDEELRSLLTELNVPSRHRPWLMLLLGYPKDHASQSPKRRQDVVEWIV